MPFDLDRRTVLRAAGAAALMPSVALKASAQSRALDVPYVPTPEHIVEAMLRLAKPTPQDFLVDLGCGDGRIPVTAALKYSVRGFGVDLNPERIKEARANAVKAGVTDKVEFVEGDLFKTDFKKASVLTLYLLPQVNMRLRPSILEMKPGTRVVSHAFHMEDWKADATEQYDFRTVHYWMVPTQVAGRWSGTAGSAKVELELEQKFQEITGGSATVDGKPATLGLGKVSGEQVALALKLADGQSLAIDARLAGGSLEGAGIKLVRR